MRKWKDIPGTDGAYMVSTDGRVRSHKRKHPSIMSPALMPTGHTRLLVNGRGVYVHHLVLETFVGPRPPGMYPVWANGCRQDNRLVNLSWGKITRHKKLLTECRRGHPKTPGKQCKECQRLWHKRTYVPVHLR